MVSWSLEPRTAINAESFQSNIKHQIKMPTATQLEKVTLNFLENTHVGDFVEWDWTACADPERTVYVDVAGNVFIGRKEIQPQVDAWSGSIASLIVEGRN